MDSIVSTFFSSFINFALTFHIYVSFQNADFIANLKRKFQDRIAFNPISNKCEYINIFCKIYGFFKKWINP